MTNILYINHYAGRADLGMEFRPHALAKEWIALGHNTLIVGATYSHLRYKQPIKHYEQVETVCYKWLKTPEYKGNGVMRVINMLAFILQLFVHSFYFAREFKPNVVIASSTYPLDIFPAWVIAKLSRAKLVFEIHDLWPMSPIEIGKMSKWHPFIILMAFGEWCSYKLADKVISILPNTYIHVKNFGVKPSNFEVVENGYSPTKEVKSLKKKVNNNLVVGYIGSIGPANALEILIRAAKKMPTVTFLIAGNGPSKAELEAESKSFENIKFLGSIAKNEVQNFLAKVDIAYIGTHHLELYKYGISMNKIFDYMESATTILLATNTTNDPISKSKCGFIVKPESVDDLVKMIRKIEKMPKAKLTEIGQNGKDYAQKYHQFGYLAKKFLKAIL